MGGAARVCWRDREVLKNHFATCEKPRSHVSVVKEICTNGLRRHPPTPQHTPMLVFVPQVTQLSREL